MANGHTNLKATSKDGGEVSVSHTTTDSPILPAANLAQLQAIDPTLVGWVTKQTEQEATNRRSRQRRVDTFLFIERIGGLVCGALIAALGLGLSVYLAMHDHDVVAGVIGGSTLVAIVSVLVARTNATQRKAEPAPPAKSTRKNRGG